MSASGENQDLQAAGGAAPGANTLNWLALRFLLAELTPAETAAFEHRLAADPLAIDALILATRLLQSLPAELPCSSVIPGQPVVSGQSEIPGQSVVPVPAQSRRSLPGLLRPRRGSRQAAGVATLVAIALGWLALDFESLWRSSSSSTLEIAALTGSATGDSGMQDPARLLTAWTEAALLHSRGDVSSIPHGWNGLELPHDHGSLTLTELSSADPAELAAADSTSALLPPDWMLAAVEFDESGEAEFLSPVERN